MARLVVDWPDGRSEYLNLSHRKPISIGSHAVSEVQVTGEGVPALAARISWNGASYEVVAAADDVLCNDRAVQQATLDHEDEIRVGDVVITLERGSEKRFARKEKEQEVEEEAARRAEEAVRQAAEEPPPVPSPPSRTDADEEADGFDDFENELEYEVVDRETKSKIRTRLQKRQRPGQQQVAKSPTVMGLAVGVVVLFVATIALVLFLRGQSIEQKFNDAVAAQSAGRYPEAIRKFERFLATHSVHRLADEARWRLAFSRVDQIVRRATPEWSDGLSELNGTIRDFRDEEAFASLHTEIAERAGVIALGAASDAGRRRERDFIPLSEQAEELLRSYSPESIPPRSLIAKIDEARRASRDRLIQLDVRDEFLGRMEAASKAGRSLRVLEAARSLAAADPSLSSDRQVEELRTAAMAELEGRVRSVDEGDLSTDRQVRTDGVSDWQRTVVSVVARPAGEAIADGSLIHTWSDDTLFACEKNTGDLRWARAWPSSFRPVDVTAPVAGVLGLDEAKNSLVVLDVSENRVLREIPLPRRTAPIQRPSVVGAAAFVPVGDRCYRVDLDSATITAGVAIGQPILAEPVMVEVGQSDVLIVFGAAETVYAFEPSSLEFLGMWATGHDGGAIAARPVTAAGYLVVPINRPAFDRCDLEMFEVGDDSDTLNVVPVARASLDGLVLDSPHLRGRDLFVASTAEKVYVVSVTDEAGGQIAVGPSFTTGTEDAVWVPTFLTPLADREFWLAGHALRRLRATPESIRPTAETIPLGVPVGPAIVDGEAVFASGRRGTGSTVTLSRIRTEDVAERWRAQLGSDVVGLLASTDGRTATVLTERGDAVRVDVSEPTVVRTGADSIGGRPLSVATLSGRLWACTESQAVSIGASGRVLKRVSLPATPSAPVFAWSDRLVIPVEGKLRTLTAGGELAWPDYWAAEDADTPPVWLAVRPVDETHVVALDSSGRLHMIALATTPSNHLSEMAVATCEGGQDVVVAKSGLLVRTSDSVVSYDTRSLAADSSPAWTAKGDDKLLDLVVASERILVITSSPDGIRIVTLEGEEIGRFEGDYRGVSAAAAGTLVVTTSEAVYTSAADGWKRHSLPMPTQRAASVIGSVVYVSTIDGALLTQGVLGR